MYDYMDDDINSMNCNSTNCCPYFMHQFQCPYNYGYRQKAEEYPLQQQGPPTKPPPSYTPKLSDVAAPSLTAVEFGSISPCIFRFTYLWLKNGKAFWSYLVFIGRTSISGWSFIGGQWVYFAIDLKEIKNFICS